MTDSCPRCGNADGLRREITEGRAQLSCDKCATTFAPLAFIGCLMAVPPKVERTLARATVKVPNVWSRPLTPRETVEQEIRRMNEVEAANRRRGQKMPKDLRLYRERLITSLETL